MDRTEYVFLGCFYIAVEKRLGGESGRSYVAVLAKCDWVGIIHLSCSRSNALWRLTTGPGVFLPALCFIFADTLHQSNVFVCVGRRRLLEFCSRLEAVCISCGFWLPYSPRITLRPRRLDGDYLTCTLPPSARQFLLIFKISHNPFPRWTPAWTGHYRSVRNRAHFFSICFGCSS